LFSAKSMLWRKLQHYILLLAGRRLSSENFGRLAHEIESLMFVYLISCRSRMG
jgi:hypothetical protein